ncbi:uncharacterized protein [Coffea arabica]|uniref:Uncharacterized protein isoform X1 n=1 Tax=Coffea arabica TaxID=13443 RepID=A0ABM4WNP6_COFAR
MLSSIRNQQKNNIDMGILEKVSKALELNEEKKNSVQALMYLAISEWKDFDSHLVLMQNKFSEGFSEIESREKKLKMVQESVSQSTTKVAARRLWVEEKMKELDEKEILMKGLLQRMEEEQMQLGNLRDFVDEKLKHVALEEKHFEGLSQKLELIQAEMERRENVLDLEVKRQEIRENELDSRERKLEVRENETDLREKHVDRRQYELDVKEKMLVTKDNELDSREEKLEVREIETGLREEAVDSRQNELYVKEEKLKTKHNEFDSREKKLVIRENDTDLREKNVDRRQNEIEMKEKNLKAKYDELDSREKMLEIRENETELREKNVYRRQNELDVKEEKLNIRYNKLDSREKILEIRENETDLREKNVYRRQYELDVKEEKLNTKDNELNATVEYLDKKQSELDRKGRIFQRKENELDMKEKNLERRENDIESKKKELEGKENEFSAKEKKFRQSILDLKLKFVAILESPEQFHKEPNADDPTQTAEQTQKSRKRIRNSALASDRTLDGDDENGNNLSKRSCINDKEAERVTIHDPGESGASSIDKNQVKALASSIQQVVLFDVSQSNSDSRDNLHRNGFNNPGALADDIGNENLESRFKVGDTWACFDAKDHMPRSYVQITEVTNMGGNIKLGVALLKPFPGLPGEEEWIKAGLPVGCGVFNRASTSVESPNLFSHQVLCIEKEGYGFCILPNEGETWAIYKDWDIITWGSHPENHRQCKFDIVEILSYLTDKSSFGIRVAYLDKMEGQAKSYRRRSENENHSFLIMTNDIYRFSHKVISAQMNSDFD